MIACSGKDEDGQFSVTVMLCELIWSVESGHLKGSGAEQPQGSKTIRPVTGLGPVTPPPPQAEVCSWGTREVGRGDAHSDLSWEVPEARGYLSPFYIEYTGGLLRIGEGLAVL